MSFVARSFSLAGEGLLRQQVAQLAEKLRREGLMDEARKRRIPVFCSRVAVVTSLSGAVIDDVSVRCAVATRSSSLSAWVQRSRARVRRRSLLKACAAPPPLRRRPIVSCWCAAAAPSKTL